MCVVGSTAFLYDGMQIVSMMGATSDLMANFSFFAIFSEIALGELACRVGRSAGNQAQF